MACTEQEARIELLRAVDTQERLLRVLSASDATDGLNIGLSIVELGRLTGLLESEEVEMWKSRLLSAPGLDIPRRSINRSDKHLALDPRETIVTVLRCYPARLGPITLCSIELFSSFLTLRWIASEWDDADRAEEITMAAVPDDVIPYRLSSTELASLLIGGVNFYELPPGVEPPTKLSFALHGADGVEFDVLT